VMGLGLTLISFVGLDQSMSPAEIYHPLSLQETKRIFLYVAAHPDDEIPD